MRRTVRRLPIGTALTLTVALALAACSSSRRPDAAPTTGRTTATSRPAATSSHATPATPTPRPDPDAVHDADRRIAGLTDGLGRRGVSIAAIDTADGVTFDYGAKHGMLCASIAKLYILETLLLQHQQAGDPLDSAHRTLATEMIENSDNDAANDLYVDIGEGAGLRHAAAALGVRNTTPGTGIYWGFTRTAAGSYIALLRDLVGRGPLDPASRHYALRLLSHVESDQAWGVGTLGGHSPTYVKNGWLAVSTDGDRWAVNSVGIATVHGRRLLVVVMTQHGSSFDGGVDLVDRLARLAAHVVLTTR